MNEAGVPAQLPDTKLPNNIVIMAGHADLAGGVRADEEAMKAILATLTRDDALFHCARVNAIATGFDAMVSSIQRQRRLVAMYCNQDQIAAINAFAKAHGGVSRIAVFFQGQMLELARWVAKYCRHDPNDGETFNDPKVRSAFVRAALVASDFWNARVYADKLKPTDNPEEQLPRALGAFRKAGEEFGEAEHTGIAMARGWLFFSHYMPVRLPGFSDLFRQATGMTVDGYFTCAVALAIYTLPNHKEGPTFRTDHVADATAIRETFDTFIALRGQTPEALAEQIWDNFDKNIYKGLRTRPIINFPGQRSAILDPIFFTESLTVAPLFDVLGFANHKEVLGAFGLAFEDYILDFLREMFPAIAGLPPRLMTNAKGANTVGQHFECDAILNDAGEGFVFEIKAAWIREDSILTQDHDDFVQQLLGKYGIATAGTQGTADRKGVAQLARSAGAIARSEWLGPERELAGARTIYPILVVHDQRLSYPGIGPFLNQVFRRYLGDVPAGRRVADLIILTVADIENLASSVEIFGFTEFLKDYASQVPGRQTSVLNFMSASRYGKLVQPSKRLHNTTDAITDAIKRELFPGKDWGSDGFSDDKNS